MSTRRSGERINRAINAVLREVVAWLVEEQIPFIFDVESIGVEDTEMRKFGIAKNATQADRRLRDALARHSGDLDGDVQLAVHRHKRGQTIEVRVRMDD